MLCKYMGEETGPAGKRLYVVTYMIILFWNIGVVVEYQLRY